LNLAHLFSHLSLGFKNVVKGFPVPEFKLLLEILELLLEAVHLGVMRYRCLPPPFIDLLLEI